MQKTYDLKLVKCQTFVKFNTAEIWSLLIKSE
jgi:hypothetical protein